MDRLPKFVWLMLLFARSGIGHAEPEVTRREALETASAYQNLVWTPSGRNAFHGKDHDGTRVDTPDQAFRRPGTRPGWWVPDAPNVGVPYMWGGFSSLEEFAAGIRDGRYAGDVYTADKRRRLDAAVSVDAVGIDCSGLVSRCWKLSRVHSTRTLPSLCQPLAVYDDLRPADILNSDNNHVLLFQGWKDAPHQQLFAFEAGAPPSWKVQLDDIPVTLLHAQGYRAYRYRRIRE